MDRLKNQMLPSLKTNPKQLLPPNSKPTLFKGHSIAVSDDSEHPSTPSSQFSDCSSLYSESEVILNQEEYILRAGLNSESKKLGYKTSS